WVTTRSRSIRARRLRKRFRAANMSRPANPLWPRQLRECFEDIEPGGDFCHPVAGHRGILTGECWSIFVGGSYRRLAVVEQCYFLPADHVRERFVKDLSRLEKEAGKMLEMLSIAK